MGHFPLTKKKKFNASGEGSSTNSKNGITIFKFGFSQEKESQNGNLKSPQNASRKPILVIDTNITDNLTPPPTPPESQQSGKRISIGSHNWTPEQRALTPSLTRSTPGTTPPQSPASKSHTSPKPQGRTSLSSLALFRTPRQRKLQEIREGKLPAILDPAFGRTYTTSSSDTHSIPPKICDPSSSTTYNPRNGFNNDPSSDDCRQKVNPLSSTITTMQMSG